jgi:hypothetical protein
MIHMLTGLSSLSRIEVNGSASAYGHGQGYRRDATNDRVFHQAAAILDLTANDILSIAVIRSSTNDPTTHLLEGSASDIQILRLDDTLDYFRARSTDTTNVMVILNIKLLGIMKMRKIVHLLMQLIQLLLP